jgi:hypothetical protein
LVVALELPADIQKLKSFSNWLRTHASLVRSIKLDKEPVVELDKNPGAALLLLQQALEAVAVRTAAVTPATATATAAAAAAAGPSSSCDQHHPQQQLLLQRSCMNLASLSSNFPFGAALVAALPAHSLTHLDLCLASGGSSNDSAALSAALARLTSLKQLRLFGSYGRYEVSGECLISLAQVTQLTSLNLAGSWSQLTRPLQQLLALPLPLRRLQLDFDRCRYQLCCSEISITHLTALTEFLAPELGNDLMVQLPAQLQMLQLGAALGKQTDVLFSLQQLQRLAFRVVIDKETLLRLTQLPALQELALAYEDSESAVAHARVWRELPQLRELSVQYECRWLPMVTKVGPQAHPRGSQTRLMGNATWSSRASWIRYWLV